MKFALGGKKFLRKWGAVLVGAATALVVFAVYLSTLAPTVLYYDRPEMFDSAMLQTQASVLGIGHPTGYPTYMMLTHLFTYLPFGDAAYRVNLASAVYGVVAVILVYLVGLRLSGRAVAAAGGALAFGLSQTFWSQAIIAEVYTLNALFIALVVFILLVWRDSREDRYLLLAAFLAGLSLTHHLTSGLLVPAGLAFVMVVERRKLVQGRLLLKGAGLFLLGLGSYLYLPIRAAMEAPMNAPDPSTPGRFLMLITGSSFLLDETPEEKLECGGSSLALVDFPIRLQLFGEYLFAQFPAVLVLIGALAALYVLFTDRAAAVLLGVLFFGCLAQVFVYLKYSIEDFYVFLIPAYLVFGLLISVGLGSLLRSAEGFSAGFRGVALIAISVLAFAAPLAGAHKDYGMQDRSQDYRGRRIVETVAQNAQKNATVLHHRSPLWYMVLVEQRRRDLRLIDPFCSSSVRFTDIVWPEPLNAAESAARYRTDDPTGVGTALAAAKEGPVYILAQEFNHKIVDRSKFREAGFDVVRVEGGPLYELVPRGSAVGG